MIKGIIFDMDGVMIDSERESDEAWNWASEQKNADMPKWLIDSFKGAPTHLSEQYFNDYYKGKFDYWEMPKYPQVEEFQIGNQRNISYNK